MSKKDKSKFRKHIKAQILQEMAQSQAQEKVMARPIIQSQSKSTSPPIEEKPMSDISPPASQTAVIPGLQNLPQIKYDLKKTGLVVGGLVLILAVLYLLDLKYNILLSFGDIIFRVLHIR